ncbi:LysM domain containing protein [Trema orientale]|uniref:LysM domain containing protein n=1 Tax=Trema orientale TaxID=63057 RepID=A0A2P5E8Q4_TREOI|nr:LysM domain containing protein [Trema orientale]
MLLRPHWMNLLAPLLNTFDFDDAVGTLVAEKEAVLTCNSVYGVQSGDTCAGVIQMFSLDAVFFSVINPNLNCDKIFAGQWLCVDGKVN